MGGNVPVQQQNSTLHFAFSVSAKVEQNGNFLSAKWKVQSWKLLSWNRPRQVGAWDTSSYSYRLALLETRLCLSVCLSVGIWLQRDIDRVIANFRTNAGWINKRAVSTKTPREKRLIHSCCTSTPFSQEFLLNGSTSKYSQRSCFPFYYSQVINFVILDILTEIVRDVVFVDKKRLQLINMKRVSI